MSYGIRTGDLTFIEKYYISDMPVKQLQKYILSLNQVKFWLRKKIIYEIETTLTTDKKHAIVEIKVKNGDSDIANSFFCELQNRLIYGGTAYITLYLKLKALNVMFNRE